MSNQIFCDSCGKPNLYSLDPPRVCGYCANKLGSSFGVASIKPAPIKSFKQPSKPKFVIQEEDEEDEVKVPNIDGLDVEIDSYRPAKISFGQLAHERKTGFDSRPTPPKLGKKKALEQIQQMGRASRVAENIGGE